MKVISIFLSSSFQDMQVERDYLRKHVFRNLEAKLMRQGARLRVMDLRGSEKDTEGKISEEEAVFMMCLQGIDSCRPRLIGLLGDRYGWIPYGENDGQTDLARQRIEMAVDHIHDNQRLSINKEEIKNKSITHLEIYYGLKETIIKDKKENVAVLPNKDCFFYFRDLNGSRTNIPDFYFDGEMKQNELKNWIREKMGSKWQNHIQSYHAIWNEETGAIAENSMEALGKLIEEQLYESILQELNKTQSDTPDTEMDTFLTYKREYTQPRKEVKDIVQFIESGEEKLLVVTGVAGCGKSTLIAQVYTMLQKEEKHKKPFLITHIAGLDADASTAVGMMKHYCQQLERRLNLPHLDIGYENKTDEESIIKGDNKQEKKTLFDRWKERLSSLIYSTCSQKPLVLLLDSADSLENLENVRCLKWLPDILPKNLKIVISSLPSFLQLSERLQIRKMELIGVPQSQIIAMLKEMALSLYGKEWNNDILRQATKKVEEAGGLPLYAQILVNHLMNMTMHDFMRFSKSEDKEKSHRLWMKEEIKNAPLVIDEMYRVLIDRARNDYGTELINAVLGIVAVTRHGLSEKDLAGAVRQLTGIKLSDRELLNIRGLFMGHLRQDQQQDWWDFEHQQMRRCLLSVETTKFEADYIKHLHNSIIITINNERFEDREAETQYRYSDFLCREYLWHACMAHMPYEAAVWLSEMPWEQRSDELAYYTLVELLNSKENRAVEWIKEVIRSELPQMQKDSLCVYISNRFRETITPVQEWKTVCRRWQGTLFLQRVFCQLPGSGVLCKKGKI